MRAQSVDAFICVLSKAYAQTARFFGKHIASKKYVCCSTGARVLLTGSFYNDNWIETHLKPIASAACVSEVSFVSTQDVPPILGVSHIRVPGILCAIFGKSIARLMVFSAVGLTRRFQVIGGFHLLVNGLQALVIAKVRGAKSIYICGGGIREFEGGGIHTENSLYRKLSGPSHRIELMLIEAIRQFDLTVTMGSGVAQYIRDLGVAGAVCINPGGFDVDLYCPRAAVQPKEFDLIFVGRLSPVKQVHKILRALARVNAIGMTLRFVVVGDGPSRTMLEQLASELHLNEQVKFVGWQNGVNEWLIRSRVFVLASESEGVSQAMIQAMLCELPVVVPRVGDLADLAQDGRNAALIEEVAEEVLASAFIDIFKNDMRLREMGNNARQDALSMSYEEAANKWNASLCKMLYDQRAE